MTRDVKVWSSSRKEIINGVRGPAQKNKRRFVVQIQLEIQAHLINTPLWLCRALALRQCEVISRSPAKLNRCCLICHLISLVFWLFSLGKYILVVFCCPFYCPVVIKSLKFIIIFLRLKSDYFKDYIGSNAYFKNKNCIRYGKAILN